MEFGSWKRSRYKTTPRNEKEQQEEDPVPMSFYCLAQDLFSRESSLLYDTHLCLKCVWGYNLQPEDCISEL